MYLKNISSHDSTARDLRPFGPNMTDLEQFLFVLADFSIIWDFSKIVIFKDFNIIWEAET